MGTDKEPMSGQVPLRVRQRIGALGGAVSAAESRAKGRALKALHARRRGRRMHPDAAPGWPSLAALLRALDAYCRRHLLGYALALFCRVPPKTVWRWRTGEDRPGPQYARRLAAFARREKLALV